MPNTTIQLRKSSTPASKPSSLEFGELAINYADGKLFYKNTNSQIAEISGGEVNYFGTVNANSVLIIADIPGDILTLEAGDNITIVGDAINDKIIISAAPGGSADVGPAFTQANTARNHANAAYEQANSSGAIANAAFDKANAANVLALNTGVGANAYAQEVGTAGNNYTITVGVASNNWANTKVASVTGTAGQIFSSGGTTPTLNLITTSVTARTYGGSTQIPVITVDTFGRLTGASNVAVSSTGFANTTGTLEGNLTIKSTLTTTSNVVTFGTAFKIDANGHVFIFGTLNMLN